MCFDVKQSNQERSCEEWILEKRHKEVSTRIGGKRKVPPRFKRALVSGILEQQQRAWKVIGSSGSFPFQLTGTLCIPKRIRKERVHTRLQTSDINSRAPSSLSCRRAWGSSPVSAHSALALALCHSQSSYRPSWFSSDHCVSQARIVLTKSLGAGDIN